MSEGLKVDIKNTLLISCCHREGWLDQLPGLSKTLFTMQGPGWLTTLGHCNAALECVSTIPTSLGSGPVPNICYQDTRKWVDLAKKKKKAKAERLLSVIFVGPHSLLCLRQQYTDFNRSKQFKKEICVLYFMCSVCVSLKSRKESQINTPFSSLSPRHYDCRDKTKLRLFVNKHMNLQKD